MTEGVWVRGPHAWTMLARELELEWAHAGLLHTVGAVVRQLALEWALATCLLGSCVCRLPDKVAGVRLGVWATIGFPWWDSWS